VPHCVRAQTAPDCSGWGSTVRRSPPQSAAVWRSLTHENCSDCARLRQTGRHRPTHTPALPGPSPDCARLCQPFPSALRRSVARFCEKVAPPFCGSNPQMRVDALVEEWVITGCEHRNMRNIKFFAARRSSSRPRAERPTQSSRRKPRRAGFSE